MIKEHLTEEETQELINMEYREVNWGCLLVMLVMAFGTFAMIYAYVKAAEYIISLFN